jgi:sec-independent protein translocase protein TatA
MVCGGRLYMEGLFQPMHLLVILVIVLLIFGPRKLGDLGKGLGEGIRNFKSSLGNNPPSTTTTTTPSSAPPVVTPPVENPPETKR